MRLSVETVAKEVKSKPYRTIPSDKSISVKELLNAWLPPILPKVVEEDFIEFFVQKLAGQTNWLRTNLDSSFRKFKKEFHLGGYRGLSDFLEWDDSLDGHFLERMIPLLQSIADCSKGPLTVENFVLLAKDLCRWENFPLSPLDIQIITTLWQIPTMSIPAVSRLLHTSYKKARHRWKRLRKLGILRMQAIPCYSKIGLQSLVVELHDSSWGLASPYVLSQFEMMGEGRSTIIVMVVPEEKLGTIARFLKHKFGTSHTLYRVQNRGHHISFAHYQQTNAQWNIDWRKLFIGAHLLHKEHSEYDYPDYFGDPLPKSPYVLDEKDIQLIPALIPDGLMKLEKLSKLTKIGLSQVCRRRTKLINLGVLELRPLLQRVGLQEEVVIRVNENEPMLVGILEELPQSWIRHLKDYNTGDNQLLVYTTLPPGSFAMMRYYLKCFLNTESEVFLSGPQIGGWPLSFENYDLEKGRWRWQDPRIIEESEGCWITSDASLGENESENSRSGV